MKTLKKKTKQSLSSIKAENKRAAILSNDVEQKKKRLDLGKQITRHFLTTYGKKKKVFRFSMKIIKL